MTNEEPTQELDLKGMTQGMGMDRKIERPARAWWKSGRVWAAIAAPLAALLLWKMMPESGSVNMALDHIQIGTATRGEYHDYLPLRATVAPAQTTLVGVLAGGNVEQVLVQDGATVERGEALATLINPELQLEVLTREAQIASQLGGLAGENLSITRTKIERQGQIAQADYDLLKAKRELSVQQQLYDKGFVSKAGVQSSLEELAFQQRRHAQMGSGAAAEQHITAVQGAKLEYTRTRLEQSMAAVRRSLDALTVRAPASGTLTNFTLQPGQALKPGDPAGQVDSVGRWKLVANVDEYYLGRLFAGQKAAMGTVKLTVSRVLPSVAGGRFKVELTFDTPPSMALHRGQSVDLRITLGAAAQAILVTNGGWAQAGDSASVFVLDKDGAHARRRTIKIGRRNPNQVEILSGLENGERIVTSNTSAIKGNSINLQ